jgi:ABC-type siderophore export system fused ATPase/permease subunit
VTLVLYPVGNIIKEHIVFGVLPLGVTISSSFVTFPAAAFIILIAAISYKKFKSKKLLSIIAGVIIVAIAGTLYIAAIPVFLYYAEFIGILLLWIGFM